MIQKTPMAPNVAGPYSDTVMEAFTPDLLHPREEGKNILDRFCLGSTWMAELTPASCMLLPAWKRS